MKLIIATLACVAIAVSSAAREYATARPLSFERATVAAAAAPEYATAQNYEQASPKMRPESVKILSWLYDLLPEGSYSLRYEQEDGVTRTETGELKEVLDEENKPRKVVVVTGSYSYVNKDGTVENMSYVADENGFHPVGESIPKPVTPVSRR